MVVEGHSRTMSLTGLRFEVGTRDARCQEMQVPIRDVDGHLKNERFFVGRS